MPCFRRLLTHNRIAPFVLGNQDKNFHLDGEKVQFPEVSFPALVTVDQVLARRHANLWRFNPSTIYGTPRKSLIHPESTKSSYSPFNLVDAFKRFLPLLATMFSLTFAYTSTYKYRLVGNTLWYIVLLLNSRLSFHYWNLQLLWCSWKAVACYAYLFPSINKWVLSQGRLYKVVSYNVLSSERFDCLERISFRYRWNHMRCLHQASIIGHSENTRIYKCVPQSPRRFDQLPSIPPTLFRVWGHGIIWVASDTNKRPLLLF